MNLNMLNPKDFKNKVISDEEILSWFDACNAYWQHSGDPKDPHAKLTSGKCSNGFFNCLQVLKYVNLSEILATQLAYKIRDAIGLQNIDWVIASPMAGITFGHDVARALGAKFFMFTEKHPTEKKKMVWNRMQIPANETVLQIEELITTSQTLNAVQEAVNLGNITTISWLPYIGTLVHRPAKLPLDHYGNRKVISLIEKEIWAVDQVDCHLCKAGSERYPPKIENWAKLTKKE